MHGFGCGVDPPGFLIQGWERVVVWVHRRHALFFLVAVASVALVTLYGL